MIYIMIFFLAVTATLLSSLSADPGIPSIKLRSMGVQDDRLGAPEFRAIVGGKVELPCNVTAPTREDSVSLVLWYRSDIPAPIYTIDARNDPLEKAKHFSADVLGPRAYFDANIKAGALRIHPVKEEDAGEYRCRLDYRWARTHNFNAVLKVIVPPHEIVITDPSGNPLSGVIGPFDDGSTLRLICETEGGKPPPAVVWWRDSVVVDDTYEVTTDGSVRNELLLTQLDRADMMAELTCQASNSNITSPVSSSVTVDMNLKPLDVRISTLRDPLIAGQPIEVMCQSVGARPPARITWWKNGSPLTTGRESISPDGNITISALSFTPVSEDNAMYLSCTGDNPQLTNSTLEDGWIMDVRYPPIVVLSLSAGNENQVVKEGNNVSFECQIQANPWVHDIAWRFQGRSLIPNPNFGTVINNQTLQVHRVRQEHGGYYQCSATNTEGEGISDEVRLKIHYVPVCKETQVVYGVAIDETAKVVCEVVGDPDVVSFYWTFNNSVDTQEVLTFKNKGLRSTATYVPRSRNDFGSLYCWSNNTAGRQSKPCEFLIVPAGPPDTVRNCGVSNHSMHGMRVECEPGYDGGLQQRFYLEVYNSVRERLQTNVSRSDYPLFNLSSLPPSTSFILVIYAANSKGRSSSVALTANTLRVPQRQKGQSIPISPLLGILIGVVAALILVAVIIVLIMRLREDDEKVSREMEKTEKSQTLLRKPLEESCEQESKDPDVIPPKTEMTDYVGRGAPEWIFHHLTNAGEAPAPDTVLTMQEYGYHNVPTLRLQNATQPYMETYSYNERSPLGPGHCTLPRHPEPPIDYSPTEYTRHVRLSPIPREREDVDLVTSNTLVNSGHQSIKSIGPDMQHWGRYTADRSTAV